MYQPTNLNRSSSMLRSVIMIFFVFVAGNLLAQAPQMFNYQGIARDSKGNPLSNQKMSLKLSVLAAADAGIAEYEEVQQVLTNEFGLYTLQIGNGSPTRGTIRAVKWESGNKYIEVAIDPAGGTDFVPAGTTQLLSVPYALYADKAGMTNVSEDGKTRTGAVSSNAAHVAADANYLSKFTALNTIGKSLLYDNGTNIGIGTTTPVARIHISQNVAAVQEHLRMQNGSGTGAGRFTLYNNVAASYATFTKYGTTYAGGYAGIGTKYPYANLLAFGNNGMVAGDGNGRFLVSSAGNIGISLAKGGTSKLKFHADFTTENVGIGGNADPVARVHLNNTDGTDMTMALTNNTSGHTMSDGLLIAESGNAASIINKENGTLGIGTNNNMILNLTPAGNAEFSAQVKIAGGNPGNGKVLTSDTNGLATWQTLPPALLANGAAPGNTPYWDGSSWIVNSSNIFNNGANVGVGTTSPAARFHVADSSVVFSAATDSLQSTYNDPPPVSGAGKRMMWYVQRGAFRAGELAGTGAANWDMDSIGSHSAAFGYNAKARGMASFAAGDHVQANGDPSAAFGSYTQANAAFSMAMGDYTEANAYGATAMGQGTKANGELSTAMGDGTETYGQAAFAGGTQTLAYGGGSFAMGYKTKALHISSTAIGEFSEAANFASTAMGEYTRANGPSSLVVGRFNDTVVSVGALLPATPLFIVGNGTALNARSNVMVARNDGRVGINTNTPNSTLETAESFATAINTTTANLTLSDLHHTVIITGGTPVITLPSAASATRRMYIIVNHTAAARTISSYISFTGVAATTIAASSSITIQSNGTNWYRVR